MTISSLQTVPLSGRNAQMPVYAVKCVTEICGCAWCANQAHTRHADNNCGGGAGAKNAITGTAFCALRFECHEVIANLWLFVCLCAIVCKIWRGQMYTSYIKGMREVCAV